MAPTKCAYRHRSCLCPTRADLPSASQKNQRGAAIHRCGRRIPHTLSWLLHPGTWPSSTYSPRPSRSLPRKKSLLHTLRALPRRSANRSSKTIGMWTRRSRLQRSKSSQSNRPNLWEIKESTMHKTMIACVLLLVTVGSGHKAFAQDQPAPQPAKAQEPAPPEHFYHLDFVVEDVNAEGKVVNSRSFSTTVSTVSHGTNSIRSGSKIPITTGSTAGGDVQFQYEDVGASFDIRNAHEV